MWPSACVGGLTFLACACAFDGFLLYFLLVSACPLPRLFVTAAAIGHRILSDMPITRAKLRLHEGFPRT